VKYPRPSARKRGTLRLPVAAAPLRRFRQHKICGHTVATSSELDESAVLPRAFLVFGRSRPKKTRPVGFLLNHDV